MPEISICQLAKREEDIQMRAEPTTMIRIPAFNAILSIAGLALLTACGTPGTLEKGDPGNPWIVTIKFKEGSSCEIDSVVAEPNACALPEPGDICAKKEKHIKWISNPAGTGFNIYFDPLVGTPLSAPGGEKQKQLDKKAPPALYKYTIMGDSRACSMDNPAHIYDPHIRVDK